MPVLNDADELKLGSKTINEVYLGANKLWPSAVVGFVPTDIAGLTVWLDASQLGLADGAALASWPDLSGANHHGSVVGTPGPALKANTLNGKPVVRFSANEGRVRGTGMIATPMSDLTILYVARMWGVNVGRIFTNVYPPYNVLIGTHTSAEPSCYDNGWIGAQGVWDYRPIPWRLYGFTFTETPRVSTFYVDSTVWGTSGSSAGHDGRWNLSGYGDTGVEETCDCEVAEFVTWNCKLSDAERMQVEEYLTTKWGL